MATQLLVSVIVPTRNRANIVGETLNSVLSQTWADFELIVSDNHSKDATWDMLVQYASNDKRVRIVKPPEPLEMTQHWNWGCSQANGQFVAVLSDDDIWETNFLQSVVTAVKNHPACDVIGTNYFNWFPSTGDCTVRSTGYLSGTGTVNSPLEAMLRNNLFFLNSSLLRKETWSDLGGFGLSYVGDFEYYIKASLAKKSFYYIDEPCMKYRLHDSQITNRLETTKLCAEVLERYIDAKNVNWLTRQRVRRAAGGTWGVVGKNAQIASHPSVPGTPLSYFVRGLQNCPWHPVLWKDTIRSLFMKSA